ISSSSNVSELRMAKYLPENLLFRRRSFPFLPINPNGRPWSSSARQSAINARSLVPPNNMKPGSSFILSAQTPFNAAFEAYGVRWLPGEQLPPWSVHQDSGPRIVVSRSPGQQHFPKLASLLHVHRASGS